ncbi:probable serine/threonine-protein kinase qkga [Phtheirospermum japonicum]|uniref:Probable serine/threonine-protein kinase qkga n=1 Tax=Phtheirospermum japonicum TaxID=374723 RepID=A0A830CQT3_9LAMI|nr:probable serine/threonine-protein kinase qkga [Phtheirospermum japonicum]
MDGRLDLPENIDPRVSAIISECWRSNPEGRPSFKDIIHKMMDLVASKTASTP